VRGRRVGRACRRAAGHMFFRALLALSVLPRLFVALRAFFNVLFFPQRLMRVRHLHLPRRCSQRTIGVWMSPPPQTQQMPTHAVPLHTPDAKRGAFALRPPSVARAKTADAGRAATPRRCRRRKR